MAYIAYVWPHTQNDRDDYLMLCDLIIFWPTTLWWKVIIGAIIMAKKIIQEILKIITPDWFRWLIIHRPFIVYRGDKSSLSFKRLGFYFYFYCILFICYPNLFFCLYTQRLWIIFICQWIHLYFVLFSFVQNYRESWSWILTGTQQKLCSKRNL